MTKELDDYDSPWKKILEAYFGILHFSVYTFHEYQHKKDKFSYLSRNSRSVVVALKLYLSYSHSITHLQNSDDANSLKQQNIFAVDPGFVF